MDKIYKENINRVISLYKGRNIKTGKGLSEKQIARAENFYSIVFPPDLKCLLKAIKPAKFFYDWHDIITRLEYLTESYNGIVLPE